MYSVGSAKDIDEIIALAVVAYGSDKHLLTEENWEIMKNSMLNRERWETLFDNAHCFLCAHDTKIVGMAFFVPHGNPWDCFDKDWSYLRMVGVHPDYRGHGIAKTLTLQCIKYAEATGENILALHTSEHMNAARHIYEKLGFKKTKELDPRFGKTYWLYSLNLHT